MRIQPNNEDFELPSQLPPELFAVNLDQESFDEKDKSEAAAGGGDTDQAGKDQDVVDLDDSLEELTEKETELIAQLKRGELPNQLLEEYRVVHPESHWGRAFQEVASQLYQEFNPGWDPARQPIRFLLTDHKAVNGYSIRHANPPVVGIFRGALLPDSEEAIKSFDELFMLISHELKHDEFNRKYSAKHVTKPEEGWCEVRATRDLHRLGYDPRAALTFASRQKETLPEARNFSYTINRAINRVLDPHLLQGNHIALLEAELTRLERRNGAFEVEQRELPSDHPIREIAKAARHEPYLRREQGKRRYRQSSLEEKLEVLADVVNKTEIWNHSRLYDLGVEIQKLIRKDRKLSRPEFEALGKLGDAFLTILDEIPPEGCYEYDGLKVERACFLQLYTLASQVARPLTAGQRKGSKDQIPIPRVVPMGRFGEIARKCSSFIAARSTELASAAAEELLNAVRSDPILSNHADSDFTSSIAWPTFQLPTRRRMQPPWGDQLKSARKERENDGDNIAQALLLLGVEDPRIPSLLLFETRQRLIGQSVETAYRMAELHLDCPTNVDQDRSESREEALQQFVDRFLRAGSSPLEHAPMSRGPFHHVRYPDKAGHKDILTSFDLDYRDQKLFCEVPSTYLERHQFQDYNRTLAARSFASEPFIRELMYPAGQDLNQAPDDKARYEMLVVVAAYLDSEGAHPGLIGLDRMQEDPQAFWLINEKVLQRDYEAQRWTVECLRRLFTEIEDQRVLERIKETLLDYIDVDRGPAGAARGMQDDSARMLLIQESPLLNYLLDDPEFLSPRERLRICFQLASENLTFNMNTDDPRESFRELSRRREKMKDSPFEEKAFQILVEVVPDFSRKPTSWRNLIDSVRMAAPLLEEGQAVSGGMLNRAFIEAMGGAPKLGHSMEKVCQRLVLEIVEEQTPSIAEVIELLELVGANGQNRLFGKKESFRAAVRDSLIKECLFDEDVTVAIEQWCRLAEFAKGDPSFLPPERAYPELDKLMHKLEQLERPAEKQMLLEKILTTTSVIDRKLDRRIVQEWVSAIVEQCGVDDGRPEFVERIQQHRERILQFKDPSTRQYTLLELASGVEAQQSLCRLLSEDSEKLTAEELKHGHRLSVLGEFAIALRYGYGTSEDEGLEVLKFLLNPRTEDSICKATKLTHLSSDSAVEKRWIKYKVQCAHESFWQLPLEPRLVLARQMLCPVEEDKDSMVSRARRRTFRRLHREPPKELSKEERFEHAVNFTLDWVFRDEAYYASDFKNFIRCYIEVIPEHQQMVLLSALLAAQEDPGDGERTPNGYGLGRVLSALGPAENKGAQAGHSSSETPEKVRAELGDTKYAADKKPRWELMEWYDEIVPPQLRGEILRIGPELGFGSFYVGLRADMSDGVQRALQLQRPRIEERASTGLEYMRAAIRLYAERSPDTRMRVEILERLADEAEASWKEEIDPELGREKLKAAEEVYDGLKVKLGEREYTFHTPGLYESPNYGPAYGDRFRVVDLMHGEHLIEILESEDLDEETKEELAMVVPAAQFALKAASERFDDDLHGGNIRVDGQELNIVDCGGMALRPPDGRKLGEFVDELAPGLVGEKIDLGGSSFDALKVAKEKHGEVPADITRLHKSLLTLGEYTRDINVLRLAQILSVGMRHASEEFMGGLSQETQSKFELVSRLSGDDDIEVVLK